MMKAMNRFINYLPDAIDYHMDTIRGDNPNAFTRVYKVTVQDLVLQTITRRGRSQWGELMDFYDAQNKNVDITENGFYYARKKMNPEAIRLMSNEYIANIYDSDDFQFKKYKGLFVLGVDGSKFILPNTKENEMIFGKRQAGNQPVEGILSTLHDCLNGTKLDVLVGSIFDSERTFASQHIQHYCDNYIDKAIFTFDRGYPSIRLIDQLIELKQCFLFRLPVNFLSCYTKEMVIGDDKIVEVTFDRKKTNEYRDDRKFRTKLMTTTYKLRFTKIQIGINDDGTPKEEILLSNLPNDEFTIENLKELYNLRWNIETSYNHLKNKMKMEEFSGYHPNLILQDIYADVWIFNLVSLMILQKNEENPIGQNNEKYTVKRNFNKAIGITKRLLIKAILAEDEESRNKYMNQIEDNLLSNITVVKKDKTFVRKKAVNKSKMSYRNTY